VKGRTIALITAAVLVLRWIWIAIWSVNFPHADQWYTDPHIVRAIAGEETLGLFDFWLKYNNEHRILLHRAFAYAVIAATGRWDSVAMMYLQSVIAVLPLAIWLVVLRRTRGFDWLTCVVVVAAFAMPLGAENMLWGFQSQFYSLVLFVLLLAMVASRADLRRPTTFVGLMALATLGYLNIACGVFCFAMVGLAYAMEALRTGAWRRSAIPCLVSLAATSWAISSIPAAFAPDPHKAQDVAAFARGMWTLGTWPWFVPLLGAAVVVASWRRLRSTLLDRPAGRFAALVGAWFVCAVASLAYGRTLLVNRYVDIQLVGVMALLVVVDATATPGWRRRGGGLFKVSLLVAFAVCLWTESRLAIRSMRGTQLDQLRNAQAALALHALDPVAAKQRFAIGPLPIEDVDVAWEALLAAQRSGQLPPALDRPGP